MTGWAVILTILNIILFKINFINEVGKLLAIEYTIVSKDFKWYDLSNYKLSMNSF